VGAFWLAPFIVLALLGLKSGPARQFWAFFIAGGLGIVFFIAGTGWSVQRYETDFLPLFVLAALLCAITRLPGLVVSLVVIPGMIVSMVFGFNGPYDETLTNKPARYVRIAQWFSPIAKYRPELNPHLEQTFSRPAERPAGTRDVLIDAGPGGARYELRFEQQGVRPVLISHLGRFGSEVVSVELPPSSGRREIHAAFDPATQTMNVTVNGTTAITHKVGPLVTAPSEIYYGPPTL
jgi:hypothetical protein